MYSNIILMEDSSKSYFGGGQRMSLITSEILSNTHHLYLMDYTRSSLFHKKITEEIDLKGILLLYGKGKIRKSSHKTYSYSEIIKTLFLYPLNLIRIYFFLYKCNLENKDTVFYCTTKKTLLLAFLTSIFTGIPYIYHAHMICVHPSRILNLALKKARKIICVSKAVQNSIPLRNTVLIYNTIGFELLEIMESKKNKKKFVVAGIGSLISIKGFQYLIDSADYLTNKDNIEIRIYGSGNLIDELTQLAIGKENVRMMGFCNEVGRILSKEVDVLVLPTIVEEALGMVILEAMYYGIPTITTNIGGQAELVEDGKNGFLVPIKDSKSIAMNIERLYLEPYLYASMSKEAAMKYENYSVIQYREKILSIL